MPGWETRGSSAFNPRGALSHWTAGPRGTKGRPSLNICTNGRAGLPGPLCNVYLDRNGVAVVVSAGVSNHGGVGTWRGQSGNSKFFGTEAECGGDGDWTLAMREAYPRVNAAYCDLGKFGPDMLAGHHEYATPAGRKIDIRDWPMNLMRQQVAALLAAPSTGGFLMALSDAEQAELLTRIRALDAHREWAYVPDSGPQFPNSKGELTKRIRAIDATLSKLAAGGTAEVDAAAIAAAIPADLAEQVAQKLAQRLAT